MDSAQGILKQVKQLSFTINKFNDLYTNWEDCLTLLEIAIENNDESFTNEIDESYNTLLDNIENMRLETLLSGKYDKNDCIISIHPGAGGTEAQDWVEMLLRMYSHWGENHGFDRSILDYLAGDEAGIKSVTIELKGVNAYGYAKAEKGVHRLVRISPFDSSGRRHTSFAAVEVMPVIDEAIEVDINPEDLRVDTYRASGAGGQHINKTDSAIRITHIPTGVVVSCQTERSQRQNKETAMKMLKARLFEIAEAQHAETLKDIQGVQKEIAWGNQIRSYVFHPYNMVKDHRTNHEVGNIGAVMDGDLDGFINAYLKKEAKDKSS
jgi:peptide chain release factor 2